MSRKANPTLIGAFVLGGALLAVIAVVAFGSGRLFQDTQTFISFFDGSVSGLNVGAKVRFRGIEVGAVREILLDLPTAERTGNDLRVAVVYDLNRQQLEARGGTARLRDPFDIDTLLALGIRAGLATESLVTGLKYIALDLNPDAPLPLDPVPGLDYPEIPTVSTGMERIEEEAYGIISSLGAVRWDTLVTSATDAFAKIGSLAGSPEVTAALERLPETIGRLNDMAMDLQRLVVRVDESLTPMTDDIRRTTEQASATMAQLQATLSDVDVVLAGVGDVMEPDSPVFMEFQRAMTELSSASRAMRDLADYLERNPSALVRGRPGGD